MIPKSLANAVVVIVTIIWTVNFAATFVVPGYHSDPLVHTAFMAICGGAFAFSRHSSNPEKTDDTQAQIEETAKDDTARHRKDPP